nr:PP2C family protein-serine/threonine phosphatase [Pyrinomonadaceae bacterium]
KLPEGKMMIALGDVSGKGTAAALLMSSLHAAIHAQITAKTPLMQTIVSVNKYLTENTPSNRFVTLFAAELDPQTGVLTYINAGHNPPLVGRANGEVEQLESGGFPLGLILMAEYEIGQLQLNSGDSLIVYSDGVSEANNLKEEEFGMDRLKAVVSKNINRSAAGLRDKVENALSNFTQTAPANDDITLVIVKRK